MVLQAVLIIWAYRFLYSSRLSGVGLRGEGVRNFVDRVSNFLSSGSSDESGESLRSLVDSNTDLDLDLDLEALLLPKNSWSRLIDCPVKLKIKIDSSFESIERISESWGAEYQLSVRSASEIERIRLSHTAKMKILTFAIFGGIFAACEGYIDSNDLLHFIQDVSSQSIDKKVRVGVSIAYAFIEPIFFVGFDVHAFAKVQGKNFIEPPEVFGILDQALAHNIQLNKKITGRIESYTVADPQFDAAIHASIEFSNKLITVSKEYLESLVEKSQRPGVVWSKRIIALIASALYLGDIILTVNSFFSKGGTPKRSDSNALVLSAIFCTFRLYTYSLLERRGFYELIDSIVGVEPELMNSSQKKVQHLVHLTENIRLLYVKLNYNAQLSNQVQQAERKILSIQKSLNTLQIPYDDKCERCFPSEEESKPSNVMLPGGNTTYSQTTDPLAVIALSTVFISMILGFSTMDGYSSIYGLIAFPEEEFDINFPNEIYIVLGWLFVPLINIISFGFDFNAACSELGVSLPRTRHEFLQQIHRHGLVQNKLEEIERNGLGLEHAPVVKAEMDTLQAELTTTESLMHDHLTADRFLGIKKAMFAIAAVKYAGDSLVVMYGFLESEDTPLESNKTLQVALCLIGAVMGVVSYSVLEGAALQRFLDRARYGDPVALEERKEQFGRTAERVNQMYALFALDQQGEREESRLADLGREESELEFLLKGSATPL